MFEVQKCTYYAVTQEAISTYHVTAVASGVHHLSLAELTSDLEHVSCSVLAIIKMLPCNAGGMTQHQKHLLLTALLPAKAVQQLHGIHMLHLGIKPLNVLVDKDGDVLLSE